METKPGIFYNLMNDVAFKMVFAREENKDYLIRFLNEIITERTIISIDYKNSEFIPDNPEHKASRYDIICTDQDGAVFIVELQCLEYDYFFDRITIYAAHELSRSLLKGEQYSNARPVYLICLINYVIDLPDDQEDSAGKLVRRGKMYMDDNHTAPLTDKLNLIFLQLPIANTISADSTWIEKFAYTVKQIRTMDDIPEVLKGDEYFEGIYNKSRVKVGNMNETERMLYDMLERDEQEKKCCEDFARRDGYKKGHAKGHAEGRAEERSRIITKLLASGMSQEQITATLGFSEEEIHSSIPKTKANI